MATKQAVQTRAKPVTPTSGKPSSGKAQLPARLDDDDFSQYAGQGMQTVGAKDILIPRLVVLQALSPQVQKKKAEYIAGAEVGMIADVGSGEVFPSGVHFLPVVWRMDYLEWAPRASGRGLVTIHGDPNIVEQCTRTDKRQLLLPNGNHIVETAQFYGFNLSAGRRPTFIPMSATQMKKSRRWLTLAKGEKGQRPDGSEYNRPLFYRTYLLGSAEEQNQEGNWYGWTITREASLPEYCVANSLVTAHLKEECMAFVKSIERGAAKADMSQMEGTETNAGTDDGSEAM